MIQNRKMFFKRSVVVMVAVLVGLSVYLFHKAVFRGNKINETSGQDTQIHVFINQNDSIIYKLQEDVEQLSSLIERMRADTVFIEIRKPKLSE